MTVDNSIDKSLMPASELKRYALIRRRATISEPKLLAHDFIQDVLAQA